jgi:uncharacterized protein (DUF1778 family)
MTTPARGKAPKPRPATKETREGRIYFRATESERWMLQKAAEAHGKSLTSFVLEAATREAERALVDRRFFLVDEGQWEQFKAALDRPATKKPRLRALLNNPVAVE